MTGVVSCQGKATGLRVMTTVAADGGTEVHDSGLAAGTHTLLELVETQNIETFEKQIRGVFARTDPLWGASAWGRVWRLDFPAGCFKEFRIRNRRQERGDRGKRAVVEADGIHMDLTDRAGIVRQPYANGRLDPAVSLVGVTPTEAMGFVRRNAENFPSWVVVGTVDWTDRIDVQFNRFMAWRALTEIADRLSERVNAPVYLQLLRNSTVSYDLNLVADPAAGADIVEITYTQNELTLAEEEVPDKFATRVYVFSGGEESEQIGIEQNLWEVDSVASNTITLLASDSPFGEADQVNGAFVEKPDGTLTQVTDTTAPRTVVVADGSGIAAGDLVRFKADAAGTDLDHLDSPSGQAGGIGPVVQVIERPDIPPVVNLAPNPYLLNGTASLPDFWTNPDGMTIARTTADSDSRYGLTAYRVTGLAGQKLESDLHTVRFTDFKRHFYFATAFWMFTGRVRLEIHDYSFPSDPEMHPRIYLPDTSQVTAQSKGINTWEELAVFPGRDFFELGSTDFKYVIILEQDSDFLLDAWQVEQRATPRDPMRFYAGSAANDLWLVGRDYLRAFNTRPLFYSTRFVDRDRRGFVTGQEVVPGGLAELTDADLDPGISAVQKRIVEVEWDHLIEGRTEVRLEQIPAHLADRFLGRPQPPVRFTIPENVMRPGCPPKLRAWRNPDLQVIWSKVTNASQYELRIPGDGADNEERWKNGIAIYLGDATNWVLKDGETLTEDARNNTLATPIRASEIDELMIETYTRFGVPGNCFEVIGVVGVTALELDQNCPNLMGPDAGTEFCSGVTSADPFVIHEYEPIDVAAKGLVPGTDRLSACYFGKTSGGGQVANFFDDFRDNNVGQAPPAGWTPRWFSSSGDWEVESLHGAYRTLDLNSAENYHALSWDVLDGADDVEILILASLTGINEVNHMGIVMGGAGLAGPGCPTGYTVGVNNGFGAGTFQLRKRYYDPIDDVCKHDVLDQSATINPFGKNDKWWIRMRTNGDEGGVFVRFWRYGTTEHCTWDLSSGDRPSGGFNGLFSQGASSWVLAAAATGGATAFMETEPSFHETETFAGDSLGLAPTEWFQPFGGSSVFDVVADTDFVGGKAMRISGDANKHARWDSKPTSHNQTGLFYMKMESPVGSISPQIGAVVRMSGEAASGTSFSGAVWYWNADFGGFATTAIILNGVVQSGGASTEETFAEGDIIRVRLQATGTTIRSRWWKNAQPEPATWLHVFTDQRVVTGKIGAYQPTTAERRWGYVEASGGGSGEQVGLGFCSDADVRIALDLEQRDADGVLVASHSFPGISAASYTKAASVQGELIHGSAATLHFIAKKKGAGEGEACIKNVQTNTGSACCEFTPTSTELPPPDVECFLDSPIVGGRTVDVCSGEDEGTMTIPVSWDLSPDCSDEGAWDIAFTVEELLEGGTGEHTIHTERHSALGSPPVLATDEFYELVMGDPTREGVSSTTATASDADDAVERTLRLTVTIFTVFGTTPASKAAVTFTETFGYICSGAGAKPAAPSGLFASQDANCRAQVAFTDNSTNEQGWEVQVQEDPAGGTNFGAWRTVWLGSSTLNDSGTTPATTGPGGISPVMAGIRTAGTNYNFRMRANNENGVSAWSNESSFVASGANCA